MRPMPRSYARSRGYTLFELLVVILMAGVVAVLVGVGVTRGLQQAAERDAVAQMVNALRAARVQAIVTGQPALARFDLRARSVQAPGRKPVPWPAAMQVRLHTAEALGSAFEFYPDGGASGGNIDVLSGTRNWRIDIAWLTGMVELREGS